MNLSIFRKSVSDQKLYPIKDMFRVCRINDTIELDLTYSKGGRGSYVLKDIEHILLAKKRNSLSKGLRCKVNDSIYDELIKELERK